jgi:hypothetical protein
LADTRFTIRTAGDREAGARCPHCGMSIAYGEEMAGCMRCGAVHHVICWQSHDGCGSFDCAPSRRVLGADRPPDLRVTADEVAMAQPLPRSRPVPTAYTPPMPSFDESSGSPRPRSALAVAAFFVGLTGIGSPLVASHCPANFGNFVLIGGMIAGIIATLLGSLALGGILRTRRRGTGFAVTGLLLGLAETTICLMMIAFLGINDGPVAVNIDEFEPDPKALNDMPANIARSFRANALVESNFSGFLAGTGIGSGVILQIEHGEALILTNRHVIDANFHGSDSTAKSDTLPDTRVHVKLIGQSSHPGQIVWIAPDGTDLALLTVAVDGTGARAAAWKAKTDLVIGNDVFTIGNPQHLDWTLTRGSVSQLRSQKQGSRQLRIIQTDASLNPGNSGGGLYDNKSGQLIGINTWITDKRVSSGLGFAISFESFLELDPPQVHIPADPDPDP